MDRDQALKELTLRIESKDNIKHSLAVEAIMRKLAEYLNEDPELWGIAGLMHDIALERIQCDFSHHGLAGGDILEGLNLDETIVYAVKAHCPLDEFPRRRKIDKALYSAGPMSFLIIACTLATTERKLSKTDKSLVRKRFYEKGFAWEINREQILSCTELNINLDDFIELSLDAMNTISYDLGL